MLLMFVLLVVPGVVFFAIGALGKCMHGTICRGICVEARCMLAADLENCILNCW